MTPATMSFRKRFSQLGLGEKMRVTDQLGEYVKTRLMPGGTEMTKEEFMELDLLLCWCQKNIFFGLLPNLSNDKQSITYCP